jgi:putative aldouronate transport system substrate-binding protein
MEDSMRTKGWPTGITVFLALFLSIGNVYAGGSRQTSKAVPLPPNDGPLVPYVEPLTVKVGRTHSADFVIAEGDGFDDNVWTRRYKRDLNIVIDNMWVVDGTQATTKMNAAIASGDYPDIFSVSLEDYQNYAANGVIADLTNIYDKYLSDHAKETIALDGGYAEGVIRLNGKMYGIPQLNNPYDGINVLFIREDWLKKLNLPVPTTVDEFTRVAEAFTNGDPDGNGRKDTYALALTGSAINTWWGAVDPLFMMFGAYPLNGLIEDGRGSLKWGGDTPAMKEALTLLNDFYRKGYIAQDFGTHDNSQAMAAVTSGRAGMFFAPMYGVMSFQNDWVTNKFKGSLPPDAEFVAAPIPGNDRIGKAYAGSSLSSILVASSKLKNPEALFKIYNLGLEVLAYSSDPQDWEMYGGGDGKRYSGNKMALSMVIPPYKNWDNYLKESVAVANRSMNGLDPEQLANVTYIFDYLQNITNLTEDKLANHATGYGLWHVFGKTDGGYSATYRTVQANSLVRPGYNGAPTQTMIDKNTILDDLIKTNIIKIAYGEENPASWDKAISDWRSLGGNAILEDANKWYKSK